MADEHVFGGFGSGEGAPQTALDDVIADQETVLKLALRLKIKSQVLDGFFESMEVDQEDREELDVCTLGMMTDEEVEGVINGMLVNDKPAGVMHKASARKLFTPLKRRAKG